MTTDQNGRPHAPAGTRGGGRFTAYAATEATTTLEDDYMSADVARELYMAALSNRHNGVDLTVEQVRATKRVYASSGARRKLVIMDEFPHLYEEMRSTEPNFRPPATYGPGNSLEDNLAIAAHPITPTETLDEIVDLESTPEFLHAVGTNPNASAYAMEKVALSTLTALRRLAITHPNTSEKSLTELKTRTLIEMDYYRNEAARPGLLQNDDAWEHMIRQGLVNDCKARLEAMGATA